MFNFAIFFGISLIIVSTGFGLHEMAHKFIAQRYGHWAEFRYSEFGLMISLFSSIVGFLIFIPGAVYISGRVTEDENGKISAGGPAVNILMAVIFWGVLFAGAFTGIWIVVLIGFLGAWINTIIAGFNMIPIFPLDGSKIWRWNMGVYIGMIIVIIGLVAMRFILI
jgi:Zn-dependent protease